MSFKSIALVISTLLIATNAYSDIINPISGLDIGGTKYDVTFHSGSTFNELWDGDDDGNWGGGGSVFDEPPTFWGDQAGAKQAAQAIIDYLGDTSETPPYGDGFGVPFATQDPSGSLVPGNDIIVYFVDANQLSLVVDVLDPWQNNDYNYLTFWPYASFQTSEVPVPPAFWLYGTGLLGLIGAARRRTSC